MIGATDGAGFVGVAFAGRLKKTLTAIDRGGFELMTLVAKLGGENSEQIVDRLVAGIGSFSVVSG